MKINCWWAKKEGMHFWQNIITKTLSALKIVKITNCEKKIDFMKTDLFHFLRMWMLLKSLPIWKEMKIKLLRLSFPFCNVQYRAFTINFSEDFFCKHVSSQIILYCQVHLFNIFTKLQHGTEYNSIQACKLLNIKTVFMNKQNTCFPSFE